MSLTYLFYPSKHRLKWIWNKRLCAAVRWIDTRPSAVWIITHSIQSSGRGLFKSHMIQLFSLKRGHAVFFLMEYCFCEPAECWSPEANLGHQIIKRLTSHHAQRHARRCGGCRGRWRESAQSNFGWSRWGFRRGARHSKQPVSVWPCVVVPEALWSLKCAFPSCRAKSDSSSVWLTSASERAEGEEARTSSTLFYRVKHFN